MINITKSLEQAQKQSHLFYAPNELPPRGAVNTTPTSLVKLPDSPELVEPSILAAIKPICYLFGYALHLGFKCPARNAVYNLCGKRGHFRNVCRSRNYHKKTKKLTGSCIPIAILSAVLRTLFRALITVPVNGTNFRALVDTTSSESSILSGHSRGKRAMPIKDKNEFYPRICILVFVRPLR